MESPKWLRWPHPAQFGTHHNGGNGDDVGDDYGGSCDDDDDSLMIVVMMVLTCTCWHPPFPPWVTEVA